MFLMFRMTMFTAFFSRAALTARRIFFRVVKSFLTNQPPLLLSVSMLGPAPLRRIGISLTFRFCSSIHKSCQFENARCLAAVDVVVFIN
jgi:hypothetical protein